MPTWQPPWDDVEFDFEAASHAERTLLAAARFLDERHRHLDPALAEARLDGQGPWRAAFDHAHEHHERMAWLLVDELRVTATRLAITAEEARAEQARREAARRAWWDEVAAEERAAATAATLGWSAATPWGPTAR